MVDFMVDRCRLNWRNCEELKPLWCMFVTCVFVIDFCCYPLCEGSLLSAGEIVHQF